MERKFGSLFMKLRNAIFLVVFANQFDIFVTQRTYRRNCECDYTVDGNCAYTLVLPTPFYDRSNSVGTCPQPSVFNNINNNNNNNNSNNVSDSIRERLSNLTASYERLNGLLGDNSSLYKSLFELQSWQGGIRCALEKSNCSQINNTNFSNHNDSTTPVDRSTINERLASLTSSLIETNSTLINLRSDFNLLLSQIRSINETLTNIQGISNGSIDPALGQKIKFLLSTDIKFCRKPALVIDGQAPLTNTSITVYSYYETNDFNNLPFPKERLEISNDQSFWCAHKSSTGNEYIQFDLGKPVLIHGVVSKGRANSSQWVSKYNVQYVNDTINEINNGTSWQTIQYLFGIDQIFDGNVDAFWLKVNYLRVPVKSRFIRYIPTARTTLEYSNICTRLDLIYCAE